MVTTSLKIQSEIKQLAVFAAQAQGVSPHAFMVDAIRVMAIAADKHAQLVADALSSREETLKSGNGFAAADVSAYLTERAQGKTSSQPTAIPWRAWP